MVLGVRNMNEKRLIISFKAFAVALVLLAIAFVALQTPWFGPRLVITFRHFWEVLCGVWARLTGSESSVSMLTSSVTELQPISNAVSVPDMPAFWEDVGFALRLLFVRESAAMGSMRIVELLLKILRWVLVAPLAYLLLKILFNSQFKESGLGVNHVSDLANFWERFVVRPAKIAFAWLADALSYFRESFLFMPTVFLIVTGLGLPSIALDFIGEYLWFFSSFDFLSLLDFLLATILTIGLGLSWMKLWMALLIAYFVFDKVRRSIAEKRLRGMLARDRSVVGNETGVFNLILGKMRASKTTILVSMSRITDELYHRDALENMEKVASMFPSFPFRKLENAIVREERLGRMHNRIQVSAFVSACFDKAASRKVPHLPFGYDKAFFYDDGAVIRDLESSLKVYAESWWLYYHDDPLIAGNISIRTDGIKADSGHFPLWDFDALNRPSPTPADGRNCKVLDWNMARLGKKVESENDFGLALDGCCLAVSEIAKERGNALDNSIYKRDDPEANPKNDYFDATLKMGGHLAYVGGKPFFKVISDDQRSGSVGSNLVDVAETIFTVDRKRIREGLAIPFYWIEPMVLGWLNAQATAFWERWRNTRDDQTLLSRFFFWLMGWTFKRLSKTYNRYSYKECVMATNSSDSLGNLMGCGDVKYYVLSAVDYAYRFDSASFSGFLNDGKDRAENGFFDLPNFQGITATKEEFEEENAYLVRFLNQQKGGD